MSSFVFSKSNLLFYVHFVSSASVCFSLSLLSQDENGVVLSLGAESQRVILSARPFRLDIMEGRDVVMSLNSRGLLAFEHLRMRKDTWDITHAHIHCQIPALPFCFSLSGWFVFLFPWNCLFFEYCLWLVVLSSSPYHPSFSYKVTSTVASVWDNIKRVFSR